MTDFSFVRGGRRKLATIETTAGGDATEIWTGEEGHLFTRCGGELVVGPVHPRAVLLNARAIAAGAICTGQVANEMALLLLALQAKGNER